MKQTEALDILKMGHNIYLTGAPGAGKTYVLKEFVTYLREKQIPVAITASTGIAATHLHGMTIHSWSGLGILDSLSEHDIEALLKKSNLKKRYRETKVLIIDEVSMLHGKRLDMLDQLARAFKDESKPFGGLQVVLSGDLFQLPPVTKKGEQDFVFESNAWKTMNLKICYLQEQHRQESSELLDILTSIRTQTIDDGHIMALQDRFRPPRKDQPIVRLYTHNSDVDDINVAKLGEIEADEKTFSAQFLGDKRVGQALASNCLAPEQLKLKVGAEVMFVANSQTGQYVNGTLGVVTGFDDDGAPIVSVGTRAIYASPHSWKVMDGDRSVAEYIQLPLRLAWAITVHKSQGMSLDAVEIDLEKSFEPGMGYVALSRVSTMDGLYIKGMNNTALVVHPAVSEIDTALMNHSMQLVEQLTVLPQKDLQSFHEKVQRALQPDDVRALDEYNPELYAELRTWRAQLAKAASVPSYVILSDKTLKLIAAMQPNSERALAQIHGIGPQKLERYTEDVLQITQKHSKAK